MAAAGGDAVEGAENGEASSGALWRRSGVAAPPGSSTRLPPPRRGGLLVWCGGDVAAAGVRMSTQYIHQAFAGKYERGLREEAGV